MKVMFLFFMLIILTIMTSSCAPNYVEVLRMGGNYFTGRADGCIVQTKGSMKAISLTYESDGCSVIIEAPK